MTDMPEVSTGKILVLGDINIDVLGRLPSALRVGGDATSPGLEIHLGGVGANTTLALARWKTPTRLLGSAGRDWFGDFALQTLQHEGVDVSCVQRLEGAASGLMFIAVEPDGQRTIFGSRGANAEIILPSDPDSYWDGVVGLHLVGYSLLSSSGADAVRRLLAEARERGAWTSLDVGDAPSRLVPQAILHLARELDILLAAFDEARALTAQDDVRRVFEALEQAGARQAVLKMGAKGCWLRERGELLNVPAFSLAGKDTTGAGDVFTAALLRARRNGWAWPEAAVLANAAGALTAAVVGGGEQAPTLSEIVRLLETNRLPANCDSLRARALEQLIQELSRQGSAATA